MKKIITTFLIAITTITCFSQESNYDTLVSINGDMIIGDIEDIVVDQMTFEKKIIFYVNKPNTLMNSKGYERKLVPIYFINYAIWNNTKMDASVLEKSNYDKLRPEGSISPLYKNIKYEGDKLIKTGGVFTLLGGLALTSGFILSQVNPNAYEATSALMIVGSLNITLGGAFILAGSEKNKRMKMIPL